MQIHEITQKTKVNEGFMDAVKGIGSIAASGVNQALGTNIGGVMAGARVGPGRGRVPGVGVEIPPGKRLVVVSPNNKGTYYKTSSGWTNYIGQRVSPNDANYLEQLADQGGRIEDIPPPAKPANAGRVAKAARQGVRRGR